MVGCDSVGMERNKTCPWCENETFELLSGNSGRIRLVCDSDDCDWGSSLTENPMDPIAERT